MDLTKDPTDVVQPLYGWYRGRADGAAVKLLVMHIQEGTNDLWSYFDGLPHDGPRAADCTIWNDPAGRLHRFLTDNDCAWTNGLWTAPDMTNPVIRELASRDTYSGDYSVTIEHAGFAATGISADQLEASARMCAFWCKKFGLNPDFSIVGHFQVGPHKNCPGAKFPMQQLKDRVKALLAGGQTTVNLPYNCRLMPDGGLIFSEKFIVNYGFKDYFLTIGGNLPAPTADQLADRVGKAVKLFGLPVSNELPNSKGASQKFERYTLIYDKTLPTDWQVNGAVVN